jgi:hypothetical protein
MTDELATINPTETVHLVARTPQEMAMAQSELSSWLTSKVASVDQEAKELKAATEQAIQNNWKHEALAGQLAKARKQHLYYSKLLQAVNAGYCLIPNFPIDVFAVRVKRDKPLEVIASTKFSHYDPARDLADEKPQVLPPGEGRYVNPVQTVKRWSGRPAKDEKGNEVIERFAKTSGFAEIEFPIIAAQAVVMDATANAMALNLFDAIGICPQSRPKGDPLIIGQIWQARTNGWGAPKMASFILAWHLDVRTL